MSNIFLYYITNHVTRTIEMQERLWYLHNYHEVISKPVFLKNVKAVTKAERNYINAE